ncbi:Gfo/Idh/MocA family protein [candidate division CSSED10-310 bacterium]|uniref:Gfo/Idh/MocA family protein n=1 Tax=candidate division CSSED10-310 bacterium TaxID=2855610 RepID=A0ABV6YUV8_UNCC1
MIRIGVIGCGYWGPNLIRNFVSCPETQLVWACDLDNNRMMKALRSFPNVKKTTNFMDILADSNVDAIAIATPVHTHFPIAEKCLHEGKHVLVEKPLAVSVEQGEKLVQLAAKQNLRLMCDHIFCYTGAVRKIKDMIKNGELGELYYFDSVRINLGLFQQDVNVIWDLAPHDLSILSYLIGSEPVSVSAHGLSHAGNSLENIAYLVLKYDHNFIAHLHLNWLSPVKIRRIIIGGSEKMLVWNDLDPDEKIKIYNKGIMVKKLKQEERSRLLVSYRYGDMYAPQIDNTEALLLMVSEFASCIEENRPALTDDKSALRVLRVLEAAEISVKSHGANIPLKYT